MLYDVKKEVLIMISLIRIDERLIHGQVAYSWSTAYQADAVIALDAEAANNPLQKQLLELAAPKSLKCYVLDEVGTVSLLKKNQETKFIIVTKSPKSILFLIENNIEIKSINVGGLYFKPGRRKVTKTVYLDDELEQELLVLNQRGVELDGRTAPTDKNLDLSKII